MRVSFENAAQPKGSTTKYKNNLLPHKSMNKTIEYEQVITLERERFVVYLDQQIEKCQNAALFVSLPFSDLDPGIPEGSIINQAWILPPLIRLHRIRQLSFITDVSTHPDELSHSGFSHVREGHSYVVAKIGQEMMRNNGYPENEVNKQAVLDLMHDIAMTAGGDAVKKIDQQRLNEEDNWIVCADEATYSFIKRFGSSVDEINEGIHNRGRDGVVLDIADKIAYVMTDAAYTEPATTLTQYFNNLSFHEMCPNYVHKPRKPRFHPFTTEGEKKLVRILQRNPKLGNIYQTVRITDNQVWFDDPKMLADFLMVRALLHKELYLHPLNQGRDALIRYLFKPFYSPYDADEVSGKITPSMLFRMTDDDLFFHMSSLYDFVPQADLLMWYPEYEKFEDRKTAEVYARELTENGIRVIGIEEVRGFNPGTNYLVNTNDGIMPFWQAFPQITGKIHKVERDTRKIYVIYNLPGKSQRVDAAIEAASLAA